MESKQEGQVNYVDTETIASAVVLNDDDAESSELQRHLTALAEAGLIEIVPSDGGIAAARTTAEGAAYIHRYAEIEFEDIG